VSRFFWSHPEWWALAGAAVAWGSMLAHHGDLGAGVSCHCAGVADEWGWWLVMVVAMMVPLRADALRLVAFRSLRPRRHRAMAVFLFGYVVAWAGAGVVVVALLRAFPVLRGPAGAAAVLLAAAAWTIAPLRRRAMIECHRAIPLAPIGLRADCDCARFGARVGAACTAACLPTMLACAASGHSLLAMLGGAGIALLEQRAFRPRERAAAWATLALSAAMVASAA
jgi:hypothetical protein